MMDNGTETLYIGDTHDGKVFVSRTPDTDLLDGPLQTMSIYGRDNVSPPKMIMTRQEFRLWREEMQDQGCTVELRFAS